MRLKATFSSPRRPPVFLPPRKTDGRNRAAKAQPAGEQTVPGKGNVPPAAAPAPPRFPAVSITWGSEVAVAKKGGTTWLRKTRKAADGR